MNYHNPAARLLALLEKGKAVAGGTNCREVWEQLLETKDSSLLMARLGKVMELPQQIITALQEAFPDQGVTWSHWENQVNVAFMVQNMQAHWETFSAHIDPHTITYLKMASSLLQTRANTKLIPDDELHSIRIKLDEMLREVLESLDIAGDVKMYLVRSLRKVIVSIDEYKLTGAIPLLDAIETTLV